MNPKPTGLASKLNTLIFVVIILFGGFTTLQAQTLSVSDIGAVGANSYNSTTGVYTLKGSGADIWGAANALNYDNESISQGEELISRVVSVQKVKSWSKAGFMLRQDTTVGSIQAMEVQTSANGVPFQYRSAEGGGSSNTNTAGPVAPHRVRIVKDGKIVTCYTFPIGNSLTLLGFTRFPFTSSVDIRLCVCSHFASKLCTATFDNVSLISTPTFAAPAPRLDIGATAANETGVRHYKNNLWSVTLMSVCRRRTPGPRSKSCLDWI